MKIFGPEDLLSNIITDNKCIGCGACIDLCPYFKSHNGKTARIFQCNLPQGRCFAYCPKAEVDLQELSKSIYKQSYKGDDIGIYSEIKMSSRGNKAPEGQGRFQSGGTVSSLISFALSNGFIDSAILTDRDGLLPVPRIITEVKEVEGCATSKYTAAPTLSALNKAVNNGYKSIGVVATPCQATAIAQMRLNPMNKPDFSDPVKIVIGLFCTWALDYRTFKSFLKNYAEVNKIKKIDIPPPPAEIMEIYTDEKTIEIPLAEVRKNIPDSCTYCVDMTSEFADISVGVVENNPGKNTIIIRTERGKELLNAAVNAGYITLENLPDENIEHLKTASRNKKTRSLEKLKNEGLVNTGDDTKKSLLRVPDEVLNKH